MNFRLSALSAEPFQPLFSLNDGQLKARNIISKTITETKDAPCRISLEDANIGERVLLLNYQHLAETTPFQATHAIYIRENVQQASPEMNQIPQMISDRIISLRAFDSQHMMVNAGLAEGEGIAVKISEMLSDNCVEYLHLHFAKQGCYAVKVVRI